MSDNWLRLIPLDPSYVPPRDAAEAARKRLLVATPKSDEVTISVSDEVEFRDCGGNWMGVWCPRCGADLEDWWGDAMSRAHGHSKFADLGVTLPCCSKRSSLSNLAYGWPVGFSRFELSAMNPAIAELPPTALTEIQGLLGRPLTLVWKHL